MTPAYIIVLLCIGALVSRPGKYRHLAGIGLLATLVGSLLSGTLSLSLGGLIGVGLLLYLLPLILISVPLALLDRIDVVDIYEQRVNDSPLPHPNAATQDWQQIGEEIAADSPDEQVFIWKLANRLEQTYGYRPTRQELAGFIIQMDQSAPTHGLDLDLDTDSIRHNRSPPMDIDQDYSNANDRETNTAGAETPATGSSADTFTTRFET